MSKIPTPLAHRVAVLIALAAAGPGFAEARVQPLTIGKATATNAVLDRDPVRLVNRDMLAMNIIASCTRTGTRMVC